MNGNATSVASKRCPSLCTRTLSPIAQPAATSPNPMLRLRRYDQTQLVRSPTRRSPWRGAHTSMRGSAKRVAGANAVVCCLRLTLDAAPVHRRHAGGQYWAAIGGGASSRYLSHKAWVDMRSTPRSLPTATSRMPSPR